MRLNVIIMAVIVAVLLVMGFTLKGPARVGDGLKGGAMLLWKIWPLLLLALAAAGLLRVLVPAQMVSDYLGNHSPIRGIFLAWGVGALLPGAPYVVLPLAAVLLERGASIGAAATVVLSEIGRAHV